MIGDQVIKDILEGQIDRYVEIVEMYQQQIYAYIYRMIKNPQDAEDLTQDTFTKAYKHLSSLKDVALLKSWLYQIAYRTTINHIRKTQLKSINLFLNPDQINDVACHVDYSMGEFGDLATSIFESLTYKEHTLLTLRAIEDMSYDDISLVMGVTASTLRKRYERLIKKLNITFSDKKETGYEFG